MQLTRIGLTSKRSHVNFPGDRNGISGASLIIAPVLAGWWRQVGDRILVVESDKADMEVEAFDAGYLAGIRTPNGATAAVGDTIAYIVPKKDQVKQLKEALEKHVASGGAPISATAAPPTQGEPSTTTATEAATKTEEADAAAAEEAAQAAAAQWISPSVDQASSEQRLPGLSPQQLQQLLRHRLSSVAPEAAKALADPKYAAHRVI